ncbi:MAG: hypothetical protein MUO26_13360 [Methanotrichaceae archaeon]|nr:hypothetical protein [Methanotrichaceae archaeon]
MTIQILKPIEGETLLIGDNKKIAWQYVESGNLSDGFGKIQLLRNGEVVGTYIESNVSLTEGSHEWIAGSFTDEFIFLGTFSLEAEPGEHYKISIQSKDDKDKGESGEFTLAKLNVNVPVDNVLLKGKAYNIHWESHFLSGDVSFELVQRSFILPKDFFSWRREIEPPFSALGNCGAGFDFEVPEDAPLGNGYYILVHIKTNSENISSICSHEFTVSCEYELKVLYPTSQTNIIINDYRPIAIKWNSGIDQSLHLKVMLFKGISFIKIIEPDVSANINFHLWQGGKEISEPGNDYFIRVATLDDKIYSDSQTFTIDHLKTAKDLDFGVTWDGRVYDHMTEWGIGHALDTEGCRAVAYDHVKEAQMLVGYENHYSWENYGVYGKHTVHDFIWEGLLTIDMNPLIEYIQDASDCGVTVSIKSVKIRMRPIWSLVQIQDDDSDLFTAQLQKNYSAARYICQLQSIWIGLGNTPYLAKISLEYEYLRAEDQDIDITPIVNDWVSSNNIKNFGIMFKGPDESQFWATAHNNSRAWTVYAIDRVWAELTSE